MIYEPIPFNRCRRCFQIKPWTKDYFIWSKRDGITRLRRDCMVIQRREQYIKHIDRIRKTSKRYRDEHVEEARQCTRRWREHYPDKAKATLERQKSKPDYKAKRKAYNQRYYQANRAKFAVAKSVWQRQNRDKVKQAHHRYNEKHPEARRNVKRRRDSYARQLPSTFTGSDWRYALEYFHGCCAYCGNPPSLFDTYTVLHEEHYIAQINGGGYTPDNIVPACQTCNLSKGDQPPLDWLVKRFGKKKARQIAARIEQFFEIVWARQSHHDDQPNP